MCLELFQKLGAGRSQAKETKRWALPLRLLQPHDGSIKEANVLSPLHHYYTPNLGTVLEFHSLIQDTF